MLTLVWIVGITNAFNLLDNMDGLCAGIALIVGAACSSAWCRSSRRRRAAGAVPGAPARRDRRLPRLQPPPGVDFHGRQRQPAARVEPRRADARACRGTVARRPTCSSIVAAPAPGAADPDLRHDARDGAAPALGPPGRRRAAAITRRTGSSRLACRSGPPCACCGCWPRSARSPDGRCSTWAPTGRC